MMTTTMTTTVVALGGTGILAVAWVATRSLRRASASLRHSIWLAALGAVLVLPLLEAADLEIGVPVPESMMTLMVSREVGPTAPGLPSAPGMTDARRPASVPLQAPPAAPWSRVRSPQDVPASAPAQSTRQAAPVSHSTTPSPESVIGRSAEDAREAAVGSTEAAPWAVFVWLAGSLLLLVGSLHSQLRARALISREVRPASGRARGRLDEARAALGVGRRVRLVVSATVRVPATWGFRRPTIVLPERSERWTQERLDRVLLHESAHIARRDCESYLLGELARAVHWFNPLVWVAVRGLREESERACDDRVLDVVDRPSEYALDLVDLARALKGGPGTPRAALAMAQTSGLSRRVRAILDPGCRRGRVRPLAGVGIGVVAAALVVSATVLTPVAGAQAGLAPDGEPRPVLSADMEPAPQRTLPEPAADAVSRELEVDPVFQEIASSRGVSEIAAAATAQERICVFREGTRRSMSTHMDEDDVRIRWETDECRVEIDMIGEVEFSADDRRVVGLGPQGFFELEERIGSEVRRVRMAGRADGSMERRFWIDGDESVWDDRAEAWLGQLLPEIFRHSTINAEARVRRMVDEGGPDRVFDEVGRIRSDHVSRRYLEILMEATELSEAGYGRVIEAATEIDSDHSSAELLMAVVRRAGLRPAFQDPLLVASERIDSDHQKTQVLRMLLDSELSEDQLIAVLRTARTVDSDHNLAELLSRMAARGRLDGQGRAAFLETLRSIDSDHQQTTVIHAFLDSGPLSGDDLARVLDLMEMVDSDHQKGQVLQRVAREYPLTGAQARLYLEAASRIDSDHQKAATAAAVIGGPDFAREQLSLVLRLTADVDSDHQQAEVLQQILQRRTLEVQELLDLLSVVEAIDSSHQRVRVLLDVAARQELGGEPLARYRALADDLGRRDREQVLAAISG